MDCRQCLPAVRAHPRSRGENRLSCLPAGRCSGSSPLTRGKLKTLALREVSLGLIPAHAGKTRGRHRATQPHGAHPRSRGENTPCLSAGSPPRGSSPLTRGKPYGLDNSYEVTRLIPAHAGKTSVPPFERGMTWAHPRSRGENRYRVLRSPLRAGSSPLTRGKHAASVNRRVEHGLIPAHAGKTCRTFLTCSSLPAHPRSRGENDWTLLKALVMPGSSPLTRGKRVCGDPLSVCHGLIPAHAGKTRTVIRNRPRGPAHPRSRGENERVVARVAAARGSSPLTRGKRQPGVPVGNVLGLIPAHAGKTLPDLRFYCADRSDLGNP